MCQVYSAIHTSLRRSYLRKLRSVDWSALLGTQSFRLPRLLGLSSYISEMFQCLLCLNWCMFETKNRNFAGINFIIWCDVDQSKEECKYLISLGKPHMVKSTVVDSQTGKSKDRRFAFFSSWVMNWWWCFMSEKEKDRFFFVVGWCYCGFFSDNLWIYIYRPLRALIIQGANKLRDKIIKTIEKRIADYTFIPAGMRDFFSDRHQFRLSLRFLGHIYRRILLYI